MTTAEPDPPANRVALRSRTRHTETATTPGERLWIRGAGVAVLGLLLLTVVMPRETSLPYDRVVAVVAGLLLLGAVVAAAATPGLGRILEARVTAAVVGITGAVMALFVGYASYYNTTWDSKLVEFIAEHPSSEATAYWRAYMSRYPNNDVLLALMRGVEKAHQTIGISFASGFLLVNVAAFTLALAGVYVLARMVASPAAGVVGMLLSIALLALSPWMSVPYTDMPVLWVPIWALVLIVWCRRTTRPALIAAAAAGAGMILAAGYCMKVTPIVGLPAALGWVVWCWWRRRTMTTRPALWGLLVLVGLIAGTTAGLVATKEVVATVADRPEITPGVSASPWTYVAAGLRSQRDRYGVRVFGGYDHEVNTATWGKPTSDQTTTSKRMIREEFERRGVVRTVWFELNKLDYNWGDGMLYAYGEGTDQSQPPVRHDAASRWVSSWNNPAGSRYRMRVDVTQAVWWVALGLCGWWLSRARITPEMTLLVLTLLGIAAFTVIFQGRSRYLIDDVPIVLAMAGGGWTCLRVGRRTRDSASA